jgi:alkanesulfonate monooxygenase SsuD/methylene tetrahydromethanopterin reductase-like flavin-dependent oxidoreductase (luciferase family)
MKYGLHLPNFGSFGDARLLADLARTAEDAGWDGFFLWDQMLFGEVDRNPHVDPWVALTAVALNTERLIFGPLVTPIPRRRPWKLARETVTLHNLSGGRLILGVGIGDPVEWEYRAFHDDTDAKIRAQKLDEGLAILKGLWSGEPFSFEGAHYQLEPMTFLPKPVTPIPIWVGGYWPNKPPFRRAARYDGVAPGVAESGGRIPTDTLREILEFIDSQREPSHLEGPYDVIIRGLTEPDSDEDLQKVAAYQAAGATWWVEDLSPERLGFIWEDLGQGWDVAPLRQRIEAGPPRQ